MDLGKPEFQYITTSNKYEIKYVAASEKPTMYPLTWHEHSATLFKDNTEAHSSASFL